MNFTRTTLDNGLEILVESNHAAATMAAGFFVRTGSRDETPDVLGVSHFLEHMVFKGSEQRSAAEVNLEFDRIGASYNAYTSEENTVYYGAVLPEFQDRMMDLLADILRPSLRQEDFDIEKQVILEEIALYKDQPRFRVYDELMTHHFSNHPLGNMILGTPESITALQRDQMQAYFDRRYSPGNLTLVAAGNVDVDRLLGQARRLCGDWTPCEAPRALMPPGADRIRHAIADDNLQRQHIGLMSGAPSAQDELRDAAQVLACILGDSSGSRLRHALIEPAIADEASVNYSAMDQAGTLVTFVFCDPAKADHALQIVCREFETFLEEGPTEAELRAARNKIATAFTVRGELPMGRLSSLGAEWTYCRQYVTLQEELDRLLAVSAEDVLSVAREFDLLSCSQLTLGPRDDVDGFYT